MWWAIFTREASIDARERLRMLYGQVNLLVKSMAWSFFNRLPPVHETALQFGLKKWRKRSRQNPIETHGQKGRRHGEEAMRLASKCEFLGCPNCIAPRYVRGGGGFRHEVKDAGWHASQRYAVTQTLSPPLYAFRYRYSVFCRGSGTVEERLMWIEVLPPLPLEKNIK